MIFFMFLKHIVQLSFIQFSTLLICFQQLQYTPKYLLFVLNMLDVMQDRILLEVVRRNVWFLFIRWVSFEEQLFILLFIDIHQVLIGQDCFALNPIDYLGVDITDKNISA